MSENIEKEIKIALTQEQYDAAAKLFDFSQTIEQTNYYYFADEGTGMTSIRVRELGGRLYLQVKAPISEDGALHIKKEYEQQLESLPEIISVQQLFQLTGRDIPQAKLGGSLHTSRKLCRVGGDTEICLDKSEYLGKVDYELEVEYTGEYPEKIIAVLKENGITATGNVKGKYARFMEAKKALSAEK